MFFKHLIASIQHNFLDNKNLKIKSFAKLNYLQCVT